MQNVLEPARGAVLQGRYPADHGTRRYPLGVVDANGDIHDREGRFTGKALDEAGPEVISSDGSFYWPPNLRQATAEEAIDYWMTVPIPDDALTRFAYAYTDRDSIEEVAEPIRSQYRDLVRALTLVKCARILPESEAQKVLSHHVGVENGAGTDTVANVVERYRLAELEDTLDAVPDDSAERLDRLEQMIADLAKSMGKVHKTVNRIDDTLDEVQDVVDEMKDTVDGVQTATYNTEHLADLIDRTVAPRGTYPTKKR